MVEAFRRTACAKRPPFDALLVLRQRAAQEVRPHLTVQEPFQRDTVDSVAGPHPELQGRPLELQQGAHLNAEDWDVVTGRHGLSEWDIERQKAREDEFGSSTRQALALFSFEIANTEGNMTLIFGFWDQFVCCRRSRTISHGMFPMW